MTDTNTSPRVLAVVCNFNKRDFLRGVLTALSAYDRRLLDVLVVDNASSDGSPGMVREEFPRFRLLETGSNLGGTGGFNAGMSWGLRRGGYEFLWLLDNDVIVHSDALEALLDVMDSDTRIGLAGSTVLLLEDPERIQEAGACIDWRTGDLRRAAEGLLAPYKRRHRRFEVHYAAACSLLARVEAVERVGIWDPAYFLLWDDIEWGIRMRRAGWRVVTTTRSRVQHASFDNRRSSAPVMSNYLRFRNAYYFFWRFCPPRHRRSLLFRQFRANIALADSYELDGDTLNAEAVRRAITDILDGRMGKPPEEFFARPEFRKRIGRLSKSERTSAGRVAFLVRDNPGLCRAALERLEVLFPHAEIDILIFSRGREIIEAGLPRARVASMDSLSRRFVLAVKFATRYDIVAAPATFPRFLFEKLARVNLRIDEEKGIEVSRRDAQELLRMAIRRIRSIVAAAYYTLRFELKRPEPVEYRFWRHREPPGKVSGPS